MSTDKIFVTCKKCSHQIGVKYVMLEPHIGKTIKLQCKKCVNTTSVEVNAALLNQARINQQKQKQSNTVPIDSHTEIISSHSQSKVLKCLFLIQRNEDTMAQNIEVNLGEFILGRRTADDSSNKLSIKTNDDTMSRNHCVINFNKSKSGIYEISIKDNNSKNGTFVNGKLLSEYDIKVLNNRDEIKIGQTKILIEIQ